MREGKYAVLIRKRPFSYLKYYYLLTSPVYRGVNPGQKNIQRPCFRSINDVLQNERKWRGRGRLVLDETCEFVTFILAMVDRMKSK